MALTLTVTADSSNQQVTITDSTTSYVTARADVGITALVFSATSKGDIAREATISTGADYGDASVWQITISDAVYLKVVLISADDWVDAVYTPNDIVYYPTTDKFYVNILDTTPLTSANPSNATYWRVLDLTVSQDIRLLVDWNGTSRVDGDNLAEIASTVQTFANIAKYEQNLTNTLAICSCFNGCVLEDYEKIRLLYEGIIHNSDDEESQEMYELALELTKR